MNLVDAYVTEVISPPKFNDKYKYMEKVWWEVDVLYNSYGRISETRLSFKTKEEADKVVVGYHFLT